MNNNQTDYLYQAQIAALRAKLEAAEAARDAAIMQARCHALEARMQRSTVLEIYQFITGATGEPGDWNGAVPVKEAVQKLRAERNAALEQVERMRVALETCKAEASRIVREGSKVVSDYGIIIGLCASIKKTVDASLSTAPTGEMAALKQVSDAVGKTEFDAEYDEGSMCPLRPPKPIRWWLSDEDMQDIIKALAKLKEVQHEK